MQSHLLQIVIKDGKKEIELPAGHEWGHVLYKMFEDMNLYVTWFPNMNNPWEI